MHEIADCYAASYGMALTPSNTCCPGRHGVEDINTARSSATTGDAAVYHRSLYIYGCSTSEIFNRPIELTAFLEDFVNGMLAIIGLEACRKSQHRARWLIEMGDQVKVTAVTGCFVQCVPVY
ncbi:hypothetical protein AX768_30135 (plasmid) [Burkholderia sp. PAMC 28687]|nr:hypothetical protein AX768_30135 [Burkholderia sp. PAMC 28687]